MNDRESQRYKESVQAEFGHWFSPYSVKAAFEGEQEHVATVGSAVDETSESKAEVKAKLSGDVRVNFKSDFLPLDKMATPGMVAAIQGNSVPVDPNVVPSPRAAQSGQAAGAGQPGQSGQAAAPGQ